MATGEEGASDDRAKGDSYPTEAHRELGLTHEQLLAEMRSRGADPGEALAFFDRIEGELRERRARGATPPAPKLVAGSIPQSTLSRTPALIAPAQSARAEGRAGSADATPELRPAELADLFGDQSWAGIVIARVSGSAMLGEHIKDGDAVLVDTRRRPRDGDIALVHLAGSGQMVRRYRRDASGHQWLESANAAVPPVAVSEAQALTLHGLVVGRAGKV